MQVTDMWRDATSAPKTSTRGGAGITIRDIAQALNV
jgi:hypothetical protein